MSPQQTIAHYRITSKRWAKEAWAKCGPPPIPIAIAKRTRFRFLVTGLA